MNYLKKYKLFNESIDDIKDSLLELKDDDWIVQHEKFDISSDFAFTDEFLIFKRGKSGYYLDNTECELFNINEVINNVIRFVNMCKIDDYKYRIITNDGQYTLDITKKINELDQVDISDVVGNTHLHFKKKTNIDLENIKFISCQILK